MVRSTSAAPRTCAGQVRGQGRLGIAGKGSAGRGRRRSPGRRENRRRLAPLLHGASSRGQPSDRTDSSLMLKWRRIGDWPTMR
jgi:hypothetical protein